MDNQHRHIAGYRELDENEVDVINDLKNFEKATAELLAEIDYDDPAAKRWVALARTHLETGFMYAIKAVAQPTNGLGRF